MITHPISAWHGGFMESFDVASPDRQWTATFTQLIEIAMGAPTASPLQVNGVEIDGMFSPSCVWSSDSHYLALPQWIWGGPDHRQQRFSIYCVKTQKMFTSQIKYSVLELKSFEAGVVKGMSSPQLNPTAFEFHLETFIAQ